MTDTRLPDGAADPVLLASGTAHAALPRRLVLGGAAALGGAVVLAACGGSSSDGDEAAGSDTSGGSATGEAGSGGGSLVASADVPVGGGVIVAAQKVVVTQPTEGEFKGFSSTCTHQGCQVSSVEEDQIVCACHGSVFSGTDGAVLGGPATAPLPEVAVTLAGDQVVLA